MDNEFVTAISRRWRDDLIARLEAARKYYAPIAKKHDGSWFDVTIDAFGPGMPAKHWKAMKNAGWWTYLRHEDVPLAFHCTNEIWRLTELGKKELGKYRRDEDGYTRNDSA